MFSRHPWTEISGLPIELGVVIFVTNVVCRMCGPLEKDLLEILNARGTVCSTTGSGTRCRVTTRKMGPTVDRTISFCLCTNQCQQ